jgi:hypothetical protein
MKLNKNLLLIFLFFISANLWGQNILECGQDDNSILNDAESSFLNEYLKGQLSNFDLKNKKILFVTGSSGNTIGSKSAYFASIKKWKETYNTNIATSLVVLTEEEKSQYGYDTILLYWVKVVLTPKSQKRVLNKAK